MPFILNSFVASHDVRCYKALVLLRDCNEKDIKINPSKMKILYPNLGYNSFNNFHYKILFIKYLYAKTSFCSDHEVAPKVIIRLKIAK